MQNDHPQRLDCPFSWPCVPCSGADCAAFCCAENRTCLCVQKGTWKTLSCMPCVPGVCELCFSPCGQYLYQLSGEADSLHTRSTANGELLYAVPSGVFPRCFRQDDSGKYLLCAGGAINRAFLFCAPDLKINRELHTQQPCMAADFWCGGMMLVCTGEGDDIRTIVYTVSAATEKPKQLVQLPGMPCGMCVCPDKRTALVSTWNGMMKLHLQTGEILWKCPEWALCFRVECREDQALASDLPDGSVWLFCHNQPRLRRQLVCAPDSQACFV